MKNHAHAVKLYELEQGLDETVARWVGEGLRAGEPVVVLATERTRRALRDRLEAEGLSRERAKRIRLIDAEETLERFMVGAVPDPERFLSVLGDVVRGLGHGGPVRAYGEMVDVLWRDGRGRAALRVEELWDELAERQPLKLLCAYGLAGFPREDHGASLRAVCDAHDRVLPAESWDAAGDEDARLRQVAVLQQRARALEAEVERRRALEGALRTALRDVQRSEEALRHADRRKDEFLAMLAHELRNPLAPILTAVEVQRLRGHTDGEGRERELIERQVRHLARLVDDLLDVSRISRGKIRLEREPVEVVSVIARAVELAGPILEARAHELSVDASGDGLVVDGDPLRLAQVFANLVSNAAKYTDPGGHVGVRAWREDDEIVVMVTDDGIGIAPEMLPHVFELFVQGERALDRAQGGLGIGLTLARSLVEMHGGAIRVDSSGLGRGSSVRVRLPAAARREAVRAGPVRAVADEARPRRVLVVDDNVDAAEVLAEALRWMGHEVLVAHDPREALRVAPGFRPEVALLDIGLPGMDGYELARALGAELSPAPRLVAVSGYGQDGDRARSRAAGFELHLVKPVEIDAVAAILKSEKSS